MRISLAVLTAVLLLACGGDGDAPASTPGPAQVDGEPLTPEDYVPDDIDLDSLNEVHRFCVLYSYVGTTRLNECAGSEPIYTGLVESCMRFENLSTFENLGVLDCLDTYATASCAELEGDHPCALVDSWVDQGGPR